MQPSGKNAELYRKQPEIPEEMGTAGAFSRPGSAPVTARRGAPAGLNQR